MTVLIILRTAVTGSVLAVSSEVTRWLLVGSATLLLPLVALELQLVIFHATLLYRNTTTYDFIVAEQRRAREREAQRKAAAAAAAVSRAPATKQAEMAPLPQDEPSADAGSHV